MCSSTVITPGGGEWSYECIDFATELTQCGGCLHDGQGHDCTAIPNALSVGCENGTCAGESVPSMAPLGVTTSNGDVEI